MNKALSLCLVLAACSTQSEPETCKNVPDGGCPLSNGVACDDPSCEAAYACTPQGWVLDHTCPPSEGGAPDATIVVPDAGEPRDVDVGDVPGANGGPGCALLQSPDCALGTVLACAANSCCGCEDLFVCVSSGWNAWGTCADGGITKN
jgi:hypothetical protein